MPANVFALPCGVDFPRALVAGLIERFRDAPPEDLARVRLYLGSGRMVRRVREAFDAAGARLLPRIGLISDIGRLPIDDIPPAVSSLGRRLELAQLVAGLIRRLPQFEPGAGTFRLADSLAGLLAEMQEEGVTPETLETLDIAETHAEHWQASLQFIRIVARYFEDDAAPDTSGRQRRVVEALIRLWQDAPPRDPIVIAGSTGSRGATALFMQAVAGLPKGAIVWPGYDFEMPDFAWDSLTAGRVPIEDHPQYRFCALFKRLGIGPGDVERWTATPAPAPERNRLVSLALRPAPVTDQWMREGAGLGPLGPAAERMTLIEAPDERAEALALALVLRRAVEEGRSAALVTPNRTVTRRVAAALDRWGILPDDSAGQPLSLTASGRFLRLVARMRGRALMIAPLLILLKHPVAATGSAMRGDHLLFTRELELYLRRRGPAFPDRVALLKWAGDEEPRIRWAEWVATVIAGFLPAPEADLPEVIAAHLALASDLAAGPGGTAAASGLWQHEAGETCAAIMAELTTEAPAGGRYGPADYADLIDTLFQGEQVRHSQAVHPGVLILGTLEARVQTADLVILAGLNEGSWPEAPDPDPWLSRQMRLAAGLLLPERQIGLSAHDFQQAIGAPEVVLSRARRDASAETVPSRWLNRLTNLMGGLGPTGGPEALAEMRRRGADWLRMARAFETPTERIAPATRPSPRPPEAARPRELPVTAIRTLIRDPYAVYAGRILRLKPLNPLSPEPDPRLRGEVLHLIVQRFVERRPLDETLDEAEDRLLLIAEEILTDQIPWPSAQVLWLARIRRIARTLVEAEQARRDEGDPVIVETKAGIELPDIGFRLTAKPDRIDVLRDGRAHLFDYKSGKPPSDKEVLAFDKQLPLEAAMVARGAFAAIGPREVAAMTYIRLGGDGETRDLKMGPDEIEATWQRFRALVARYLRPETGYTARRAMQTTTIASDYDHLSRFGEWQISDPAKGEDVE